MAITTSILNNDIKKKNGGRESISRDIEKFLSQGKSIKEIGNTLDTSPKYKGKCNTLGQ